jgi:hypothetical protein
MNLETTLNWLPLDSPTAEELASTNYSKAQTGAVLINSGVVSSEEERQRVATDKTSGYDTIGLEEKESPEGKELAEKDYLSQQDAMDEGEHWITIRGTHALVNGNGKIIEGPNITQEHIDKHFKKVSFEEGSKHSNEHDLTYSIEHKHGINTEHKESKGEMLPAVHAVTISANKSKSGKSEYYVPKLTKDLVKDAKDPCWEGYKQVGMKDKNGKQVPNCVSSNDEKNYSKAKDDIWIPMPKNDEVSTHTTDKAENSTPKVTNRAKKTIKK